MVFQLFESIDRSHVFLLVWRSVKPAPMSLKEAKGRSRIRKNSVAAYFSRIKGLKPPEFLRIQLHQDANSNGFGASAQTANSVKSRS